MHLEASVPEENPSVLVVDDDEFVRKLISTVVSKSGYRAVTAKDGREALEKLEQESFHAILLDLMMPNVDGFEVMSTLEERDDSTPIIVMTAADDSLLGRVPRERIEHLLRKPFDVQELTDRLEKLAG